MTLSNFLFFDQKLYSAQAIDHRFQFFVVILKSTSKYDKESVGSNFKLLKYGFELLGKKMCKTFNLNCFDRQLNDDDDQF